MAASAFLFISFIVVASCLLPAVEWRFHNQLYEEDRTYDKPVRSSRRRSSGVSIDEKKTRRTRVGPRRSMSSAGQMSVVSAVTLLVSEPMMNCQQVKDEDADDVPVAGTSTSGQSPPLRRRRSRLSHHSDSDN